MGSRSSNLHNNCFININSLLILAIIFWALVLTGFPTNVLGQVTIPLSKLNPKLTENITGKVHDIEYSNGHLYIGTENGLWIISNNYSDSIEVNNIKEEVYGIDVVGNRIFVQTGKHENEVEVTKGASRTSENPWTITKKLWIVSEDGASVNIGDIGRVIRAYDFHVIGEHFFFRADPSGKLWIADKTGSTRPINLPDIDSTAVLGDELLVATTHALWLINENGEATPFRIGLNLKTKLITQENIGVGFNYERRIDITNRSAFIKSALIPNSWWGKFIASILPENFLPAEKIPAFGYYADKEGADPFKGKIPHEFRFAVADGPIVPPVEKFSPQEVFTYEIRAGRNEVRYWVLDYNGNFIKQEKVYYGIPGQYFLAALPFVLAIASATFVLGCFALAPKVSFCHSAIMNPWLRRYFSLGSVPLFLSVFPPLRRHLLRRYSASISNDKEFSEWKERFVCPSEEFYPETFGNRIESERRLLLTGQSGVGKTSYFKRLAANYASQDKPTHPADCFPVYIPLTNYGGNSLEELIYNQLFSYGKITDKELAPMFLEQGGLLIFLDGVNEVQSVTDRQKLSAFVEKFWAGNYICLSSQHPYPEIENIPVVELKSFSREKVREFIRQRANDKRAAEDMIKKLADDDYKLYSIPRDLEFAVEILNSGGKSLPRSRTELYKTIFSSIFAKWRGNGGSDAADDLCKHAYTMIVQRDLSFDSVFDPHFKQITVDLFEQRFLIRREGAYYFRHELIRSYLASEYFYPRWENLIEETTGKAIDSNWLEMLKFSCENLADPAEVKSLIYEVLKRSVRKDLVKNLFEWLKANHPNKCEPWEQEFYAKYGELDFNKG